MSDHGLQWDMAAKFVEPSYWEARQRCRNPLQRSGLHLLFQRAAVNFKGRLYVFVQPDITQLSVFFQQAIG
jgi:hypothetical protein